MTQYLVFVIIGQSTMPCQRNIYRHLVIQPISYNKLYKGQWRGSRNLEISSWSIDYMMPKQDQIYWLVSSILFYTLLSLAHQLCIGKMLPKRARRETRRGERLMPWTNVQQVDNFRVKNVLCLLPRTIHSPHLRSRDWSLSFAYRISLCKLAAISFSIYTHVNADGLSRNPSSYLEIKNIIGAGVFRAAGLKSSSARTKGKGHRRLWLFGQIVCALTLCESTQHTYLTYNHWAQKTRRRYMCWASGVCAINPGAQNFHSHAFIVSEQHLTDVSAAATGSFACNQ